MSDEMSPEEFVLSEKRYADRMKLQEEIRNVVERSGMTSIEVMFVLSAIQYSIMGYVISEDIKYEINDALGNTD